MSAERHRVRLVVVPAAHGVMQVVELADHGHPGQRHLRVDGPGQREIGVGVESSGNGIHLLAPGPEGAGASLGAAAQRPVERVAVCVGRSRQRDSRELHVPGLRVGVGHDRREPPRDDLQAHPWGRSAREPSVFGPVRRHGAAPQSSATTAVSARHPSVAVGLGGRLRGGVRHPGRVAHEEHRCRYAVPREDPCVVPGTRRQQGRVR